MVFQSNFMITTEYIGCQFGLYPETLLAEEAIEERVDNTPV